MPSNYWIKAYVEILDDPKMATLPDRLWRRVMELFLLAGKFNKGGELPDTKQLAWVLRVPTDDLDLDMRQIETTGIIRRTADGWLVVKYAERQAASPARERMAQWRERQHQQQYYSPVTEQLRIVTQITESESDTDTDAESEPATVAGFGEVCTVYENNIGMLTAHLRDELISASETYPHDWIIESIKIAVSNNVRKWAYCRAILERWMVDGKDSGKKNGGKAESDKPYTIPEDDTAELEFVENQKRLRAGEEERKRLAMLREEQVRNR